MVTFKVTVMSRLRSWPGSRSRRCLGDISVTVSVSGHNKGIGHGHVRTNGQNNGYSNINGNSNDNDHGHAHGTVTACKFLSRHVTLVSRHVTSPRQ